MTKSVPPGVVALVWLATLWGAEAAIPSFDCDSAHTEVEHLICSDEVLAELDARLARKLAGALARADADKVAGLYTAQRVWRTRMLKYCAQADNSRACVLDAYDKRLGELGQASP